MLTLFAVAQWNQARASVAEMKELGEEDWTLTHAFYANAGGFLLHTPDCPPFPINAKSIHYLCSKRWIECPRVSRHDIWDRSKADKFAKLVALTQAAWLVTQVIARAVQNLAITPLELFAVAFVVPTLATAFFWANKPQDVNQATTIKISSSVSEIIQTAGEAAKRPWSDTPLDFIEKPSWNNWARRPVFKYFGGLRTRPIDRIPNDYVAPPSGRQSIIVWVVSVIHAAVHVAGWSFSFPTRAEVLIWRCSSIVLLLFMITGGLIPVLSTKPWFNFKFTLLWVWERSIQGPNPTWVQRYLLDVVSELAYVMYIIARILILAEICITFRSLPASAYDTVNWTAFLPHIGG
ncbi:hypothetical protein JX265_007329 [Neoarthrinium moseri]|uniref:Uncharacterized protein n=1 Tax=Neoarthrinium moseri TaxID=1658444 RepID=A0A9P9WKD2_9PEZI|nr:uncharacterized protein JN550_009053 [Neoarthrinium moseri]KAI1843545.1 hypothetical protein JX266_010178 [Neoarthrinium moseri]KAI1864033.1 hypothetical protein JN550_009053 [Neoarthrinium moseri]KAI1867527.1 hypothetical protein JX265_007329 [Neoarthrinium moseri]